MQLPAVFDYELPDARIAQRPVRPYDAAKLLVVNRASAALSESSFTHICDYLRPEDLLIFNDTAVIAARFLGTIEGSTTSVELLILREHGAGVWEALGRPLRKLREGTRVLFADGLTAQVIERPSSERVTVQFSHESGAPREVMARIGLMPIPPYIRRGLSDESDKTDYQTIFARREGSVAAPTASLHFTPELMAQIRQKGTSVVTLTLHVGAASFLPLWHEGDETLRPPGAERFEVPDEVQAAMVAARARGGRVIAVGTTVVRALESAAARHSTETTLFITPGYSFRAVDALVTNFHQPRTTHLLLVEALLGRDLLAKSYRYALDNQFRFLSYGDGMLIA